MTRSMSLSPTPDVFPIQYFNICLVTYFCSAATPPSSSSSSPLHASSSKDSSPIRRRRDCFPRNRYIGCEAASFPPGVIHRHSQLPRK